MNELTRAGLQPVAAGDAPDSTPDLTELHYDVWTLRLTLDFDDMNGVAYADFSGVSGFRVLDESDLKEMWPADDGWIYEVESGGWLAQEDARTGFSGDADELTEYLVVGVNDCVSVLATEEPTITVVEFDD